ncbi:FtsK/SpoIIIE domain-containing protein [Micromonospora sp. WMMA1363]|uniref:FtsK/SpoIIIE domain-containing protein n=1 Tax=Micromonospora sp. WMMA1363 TaxID=3053985 RepID=UPI00259CA019|nr:FtsK/SpoIIIE domain-containing protein [Micromonospora sp. WMMA1363]MDM4718885.1 FtsK/SpoIIIE domain-containing protein [Micromonospora sp. WMMA1363]
MADRRAQLAARVRRTLGEALGAARTRVAGAQAEVAAERDRLTRVRRAAAAVPARVGAQRDRRLADIDGRHATRIAELTRRAADAAHREAPGAASAEWERWRPTPAGRATPQGALRVGTLGVPGADPVPALVPLLDAGHVALVGEDRVASEAVVSALLLRAIGHTAPGTVRLTGYDPEHLGGGVAGFAPLGTAGLLTSVGPGGLGRLLDDLVEHIRRINAAVLAGEHASLRELAAATGRRPEPWRVAVLLGGEEPSRRERGQLDRIVRTGAACGVHLVVRGLTLPDDPTVTRIRVGPGGARVAGAPPVHLDPAPPATLVTETCRAVATRVNAGPAPTPFTDLLPAPEQMWREDSATGLTAPIGAGPDGRPVRLALGDYPPHALIGGPSGTGKTNLIFAWIGALAARYSPAELEFYLLDFKEGVSFARFAQGRRDPSWLPHMRLVGINVNTDREFGLALLRFLAEELRRRADAAKKHEVTKLAELRAVDPTGHWPRIVAVVDEFQMLLAGRDAVAREAADLLEDLARRGRSQGIHLVLASQDVRGIEALWGRPALVAQFTLRIALPKALRILAERNDAAQSLPRHHAVVNAESGLVEGNEIARIPAASDWETWSDLQHRLWRMRPPEAAPARLFDGDAVPRLADAPDFRALSAPKTGTPRAPVALLGEIIDVQARSAALRLPRAPGRNLAVLGTRVDEACAVLDAAARSLARQHRPGTARFSIACLDPDADPAARALYEGLAADDAAWYDEESVTELMAETAAGLGTPGAGSPHYLLLYAVDAAAGSLATRVDGWTGLERLRRILHDGPERRTHVLAWWRGVARMRADLGGPAARTDQIGAWVALDAHGGELGSSLYPGTGGPDWYPRPWRGLFFDRAVHRTGQTVIPYGPER